MAQELRIERGRAIAKAGKVRAIGNGTWLVLSQSAPKTRYTVDPVKKTCTCPDFETWELDCKHIYAVRFFQNPNFHEDNPKCEEPMRPVYSQDWPAYNEAQIHEQEHFEQLLEDLCRAIPEPEQKTGRPRIPLKDAVYAAVTKVYGGKSGRRASTAIKNCKEHGHIDHAPHHNSISHYLGMERLTPILKRLIEVSAAPLKALESEFAADATGFSTSVYNCWFEHKYGEDSGKRQRWIKAHAMVGVRTNVITAIEVTEGYVADTTQLPDLLATTAKTFNMKDVSADKGYLSNLNLMAIEAHNAQPFVPFKLDSQGTGSPAWERMWHMFWFQRDEFLKRYHLRSNVEATFSALKRKLGGSGQRQLHSPVSDN